MITITVSLDFDRRTYHTAFASDADAAEYVNARIGYAHVSLTGSINPTAWPLTLSALHTN